MLALSNMEAKEEVKSTDPVLLKGSWILKANKDERYVVKSITESCGDRPP